MTLSRTLKIIVGAATALVAVWPMLIMAFMFLPIFFIVLSGGQEPDLSFILVFFLIFPLMIFASFLQMGLMVFYIAHIVKNKAASEVLLILLGAGLYFLPFFAMPAYYLIYILPSDPPDWAMAPKSK
jgi:hypothetical protein